MRGRRPPPRAAQRQDPRHPRCPQHRDVHLPPPATSRPTPGEPDDATPSTRRRRARASSRTGTSGCTSAASAPTATDDAVPIIVARRGLLRLGRARQALPRRAVRAVHRAARARPRATSPRPPRARPRRSSTSRSGRYAHPPAIELAARLAELAPGDLNRVFFTTGGSEAVESAWKLARQYFRAIGQAAAPQGDRPRDRLPRHDARRARDHRRPGAADAVRAAHARARRTSPNTNRYRHPLGARREGVHARGHRRDRGARSSFEGPETVAAVFLEPVQNAGGCLVPPEGYFAAGARDLRPLRRAARVRRGHLRVRAPRRRCSAASATTTCPT